VETASVVEVTTFATGSAAVAAASVVAVTACTTGSDTVVIAPDAAAVTGSLAEATVFVVELTAPVTASVAPEIVCVTLPESGWACSVAVGSAVVAWCAISTVPSTLLTGAVVTASGDATDWVGSPDTATFAASVGVTVWVAASGACVTDVVTGSAGAGAVAAFVGEADVCVTGSVGWATTVSVDGMVDVDEGSAVDAAAESVGAGALVASMLDVVVSTGCVVVDVASVGVDELTTSVGEADVCVTASVGWAAVVAASVELECTTVSVDGMVDVDDASAVDAAAESVGAGALVASTLDVDSTGCAVDVELVSVGVEPRASVVEDVWDAGVAAVSVADGGTVVVSVVLAVETGALAASVVGELAVTDSVVADDAPAAEVVVASAVVVAAVVSMISLIRPFSSW
jgi:hypothetical protein